MYSWVWDFLPFTGVESSTCLVHPSRVEFFPPASILISPSCLLTQHATRGVASVAGCMQLRAWLVFGAMGLLGLWRALRPGPRRGALLRALVPVAHCCCAVFAAAPCGQPTAPPAVLRCACSPSTIQRARRPSSDPHMPPNARRRRTESALPRGPPGPPSPLLLGASCPRPIGKMSYYWAGLSPVEEKRACGRADWTG